MQPKDNFSITRVDILHGHMCYVLVFVLVLQGFLSHIEILGQPIWIWMIASFLPFIPRYAQLIFNLKNLRLKGVYLYLFTLCFFLALVNLYNSQDIRRVFSVLSGVAVATIIFYEFRKNITPFIKLIIFVFIIQSLFSIMQFYFDLEFFDGFQRGKEECGITIYDCTWIVADSGSSGTFGYPVPFGYLITTFVPIVYPYILPAFQKPNSRNINFIFLILFSIFGLILSMQRGAILFSIISIILMNIFILKRSFNMIALPLTILIPSIFFKFISPDKVFFSLDLLIDRFEQQLYWFNTGEFSAHMYLLNIFSRFGLIGIFFIIIFYLILIKLLKNHLKYRNTTLPKGVIIGSILSIISYQFNALFHNNGHFMLDVVGFISIGYFFALTYFIFENKDDSYNS
ncbi:hypothetical protein N8Z07_00805 [Pelagibacteraceae bacterium]|nr:hypothetical protein [Pelagibacteraceae bacterium]